MATRRSKLLWKSVIVLQKSDIKLLWIMFMNLERFGAWITQNNYNLSCVITLIIKMKISQR